VRSIHTTSSNHDAEARDESPRPLLTDLAEPTVALKRKTHRQPRRRASAFLNGAVGTTARWLVRSPRIRVLSH
jgi:hypothetical protein